MIVGLWIFDHECMTWATQSPDLLGLHNLNEKVTEVEIP